MQRDRWRPRARYIDNLYANIAAYHVAVRTMYDTDRIGHAPHKILRRTACVHRSRDAVRCVAPFVLLLVDGFECGHVDVHVFAVVK